jgi:hypothetical protein
MTPSDFREALRLPQSADVDRRVPKNAFLEQIKGAGDRRLFDTTVERLDWLATLSPVSIGVATASFDSGLVEELLLFTLSARKEPTQRLLQVIHQSMPYPLLLVTQWLHGKAARLSLLPRFTPSPALLTTDLVPCPATSAFADAIALAGLPSTNLAVLYDALIERVQALLASQISNSPFRVAANAEQAKQRASALEAFAKANTEYRSLKAAATREKRLARAVELGAMTAKAKASMEATIRELI